MTAYANSLTERASGPVRDGSQRWSMTANDARAFVNAFGCLGYKAETLLASAGLVNVDLQDPDARIPCEALGAIIACAQRERFTPNLGLELARVTPLGAYPLLDYLVLTSDTVGTGVSQLARYFQLVGNPVSIDPHEDCDPIRVAVIGSSPPFSVEYTTSLMILHFRNETGGEFVAGKISFQHKPDNVVEFERLLGCPVQPLASSNAVTVPRDIWRLPLRRRDPVLRQMLEGQANDILARLPARSGLAFEVQHVLAARIAGGDTQVGAIARQLGVSVRTLQRRLAAEGASYQELLDDARKEAAERYMTESGLAICEIAYLLGFSEPAPFHRAFKRWYGMTPEGFRQKQREGR